MFGRDPIVSKLPLETDGEVLVKDENILSIEALKNMYQIGATNLELDRNKNDNKAPASDRKLKEIQFYLGMMQLIYGT